MIAWTGYLSAGYAVATLALAGWAFSLVRRNVNIVDSLWSLMFLTAVAVYVRTDPDTGPRTLLVLALVALWAIRLSVHITVRNCGEAEDHRYQQIRRNNEPNFALKSIYIVFGLQAALAWIISIPLLAAMAGTRPLGLLDVAGAALWIVGMGFEVIGDYQLTRFRHDPANRGRVLNRGLWRYTRHPNYFGEFCIWWGFWLLAAAAGAWWTVYAPLLMSILLLRVSGVALLEKDIANRRPAYREYIATTNAFFPGPPRPLSIQEIES